MGDVLLVAVDAEIATALERRHPCTGSRVVAIDDPSALSGMQTARAPLDAVVLGARVKEPITLAQCAHRLDRDSSVMILTHAVRRDDVVAALRTAPGLAGEVRCVSVEDPVEVCRDLTEAVDRARKRRNHRQTLAAVNAQLRAAHPPRPAEVVSLGKLLDYAPAGVCAVDSDERIFVWNLRAEQIFERSGSEVMGQPFPELLDDDARAQWIEFLNQTRAGDSAHQVQLLRRRLDGSQQHLEVTAAPMEEGPSEHAVLLVCQDITERKLNEVERTELLRQTQLALAVRDEFLDVASHELRTPLTSLRLMVQALERQLEEIVLPEDQRTSVLRKVRSSDRQVVRLTRLVEALLDVSSIQSGRLRLERTQVDLSKLTTRLATEFEEPARRAGCTLVLDVLPGVTGSWDARRLEQVVLQLLQNAIRYAPRTAVGVKVTSVEGNAVLEVSDRGIGIAPRDLDRIFSRFERAAPTRHFGGLGLGLYISRNIVEAHGGTMSARSAPGQGSTFRITLPPNPY